MAVGVVGRTVMHTTRCAMAQWRSWQRQLGAADPLQDHRGAATSLLTQAAVHPSSHGTALLSLLQAVLVVV